MMPYDEALRRWGLNQLLSRYPDVVFDVSTVTVEMDFNEGYACCNGYDPNCYCSFAESPRSEVLVSATVAEEWVNPDKMSWVGPYPVGYVLTWTQQAEDFDFAEMVRELFEISKED